ncbi:PREDICTED: uncharacterized protein LOC104814892 [Tarenaya hassleriana]|uniref:uncharacterized protein LOC104814892 n=1 Tax=Tarenaya hassleriana TaxID=28532 RepID=UPI00053C384A|nr:PREDICTED: uncharacterized protein LOC104814892 [Tarenaya hassleriana]XP_010541420.1 PREDICTED: uncharacterized protein LOC104814892 [Tarenaya hassleriana]
MEGKGRVGSSSSSFTAELFGTKDPQPPSSSGAFASIFPPPSKTGARNSPTSNHGSSGGRTEYVNMPSRESNPPCHLSSSLHYGGQEVYSPTTNQTYHHPVKDHRGEVENGNNSQDAYRGNWWQGSLYY